MLASSATAQPPEGVILLHGLARTAASMARMEAALTDAGYVVVNVDYPSRTATIDELAEMTIHAALQNETLRDCPQIHFVTHSLGGILVRTYFAQHTDGDSRPKERSVGAGTGSARSGFSRGAHLPDRTTRRSSLHRQSPSKPRCIGPQANPRLGRVVMLGPPNQGSEIVDKLGSWKLFQKLNGPAGSELGTDEESIPNQLGPVDFELGIIAGDRSINWINSLIIPGPDDGKVSVERTKVAGMKAHLVIHAAHPFLMKNKTAIRQTLAFLKTGKFATDQSR